MDERERDDHEKELMKQAMKEGMKEWLDERYAAFVRWTVAGAFGAAALMFFSWLVKIVMAASFVSLSAKGH